MKYENSQVIDHYSLTVQYTNQVTEKGRQIFAGTQTILTCIWVCFNIPLLRSKMHCAWSRKV